MALTRQEAFDALESGKSIRHVNGVFFQPIHPSTTELNQRRTIDDVCFGEEWWNVINDLEN